MPGNYPVTVTVTDAFGQQKTEEFTASVAGTPPAPSILDVPSTINAGSSVTLGSSVSDSSQAETALGFSYSWSVTKDGVPYMMPGNPATNLDSFTFTPTAAGGYVINLAVTDHANDVGNTSTSFTITQVTPVVSVTASNATYNGSAFNGSPVTTVNGTVTSTGITYTFTALGSNTQIAEPSQAGTYTVTANFAGSGDYTAGSASANFTIYAASTSVSGSASGTVVGNTSLTATVTSAGGTPAGSVDFYDSTTMTDLGSATLNSSGTATLNLSVPLEAGSQSIVLTFTSGTADFNSTSATISVNEKASIYVLNATAGPAVSVSGSSTVTVPGTIQVASRSSNRDRALGHFQAHRHDDRRLWRHVGLGQLEFRRDSGERHDGPHRPAGQSADPFGHGTDNPRGGEPGRCLDLDDRAGHLSVDQRQRQRQADDAAGNLCHHRRRVQCEWCRRRERLGRFDLQRRKQL